MAEDHPHQFENRVFQNVLLSAKRPGSAPSQMDELPGSPMASIRAEVVDQSVQQEHQPQIGAANSSELVTEENLRAYLADPEYVQFYYANRNINPRLPPPLSPGVGRNQFRANFSGPDTSSLADALAGTGDPQTALSVLLDAAAQLSMVDSASVPASGSSRGGSFNVGAQDVFGTNPWSVDPSDSPGASQIFSLPRAHRSDAGSFSRLDSDSISLGGLRSHEGSFNLAPGLRSNEGSFNLQPPAFSSHDGSFNLPPAVTSNDGSFNLPPSFRSHDGSFNIPPAFRSHDGSFNIPPAFRSHDGSFNLPPSFRSHDGSFSALSAFRSQEGSFCTSTATGSMVATKTSVGSSNSFSRKGSGSSGLSTQDTKMASAFLSASPARAAGERARVTGATFTPSKLCNGSFANSSLLEEALAGVLAEFSTTAPYLTEALQNQGLPAGGQNGLDGLIGTLPANMSNPQQLQAMFMAAMYSPYMMLPDGSNQVPYPPAAGAMPGDSPPPNPFLGNTYPGMGMPAMMPGGMPGHQIPGSSPPCQIPGMPPMMMGGGGHGGPGLGPQGASGMPPDPAAYYRQMAEAQSALVAALRKGGGAAAGGGGRGGGGGGDELSDSLSAPMLAYGRQSDVRGGTGSNNSTNSHNSHQNFQNNPRGGGGAVDRSQGAVRDPRETNMRNPQDLRKEQQQQWGGPGGGGGGGNNLAGRGGDRNDRGGGMHHNPMNQVPKGGGSHSGGLGGPPGRRGQPTGGAGAGGPPGHGPYGDQHAAGGRRGPSEDGRGSANANNTPLERRTDPLLDQFKNNKSLRFVFSDILGHVPEFSMDQQGSRFIQQKLEHVAAAEKEAAFVEKFFEFGTPDQRLRLADAFKGKVVELSLQMYGCRVVQKALEVVPLDKQCAIIAELDNQMMRCVRDQNGNHVIQKIVKCVPSSSIRPMINQLLEHMVPLSSHPFGCRVIQRLLEHCLPEVKASLRLLKYCLPEVKASPRMLVHCLPEVKASPVMKEVLKHITHLAQDQYGNYVIQHVVEHGEPSERQQIQSMLAEGQAPIKAGEQPHTPSDGESLGEDPLQHMMKDQFGNYVVQRVLEVCDDAQREALLSRVRAQLSALKRYTYGKHIVARVEKLLSTGTRLLTRESGGSMAEEGEGASSGTVATEDATA
eukprot:gene14163-20130_t